MPPKHSAVAVLRARIAVLQRKAKSLARKLRRMRLAGRQKSVAYSIRNEKYQDVRSLIRDLNVERTNIAFAQFTSTLAMFQKICLDCYWPDESHPPSSIEKAKAWIKAERIFVNIFKYTDYLVGELNYFPMYRSLSELRASCGRTGFFPREGAKSAGLQLLLQVMFSR